MAGQEVALLVLTGFIAGFAAGKLLMVILGEPRLLYVLTLVAAMLASGASYMSGLGALKVECDMETVKGMYQSLLTNITSGNIASTSTLVAGAPLLGFLLGILTGA
ncbi:MAG: hypothetical protein GXO09_03670 [Crenarchaeota archaeon]|nr:hypothetical protein [Thermoproteota archaeon]